MRCFKIDKNDIKNVHFIGFGLFILMTTMMLYLSVHLKLELKLSKSGQDIFRRTWIALLSL